MIETIDQVSEARHMAVRTGEFTIGDLRKFDGTMPQFEEALRMVMKFRECDEQNVLFMRVGIYGPKDNVACVREARSVHQVANLLKMSKSTVTKREREALAFLNHPVKRAMLQNLALGHDEPVSHVKKGTKVWGEPGYKAPASDKR